MGLRQAGGKFAVKTASGGCEYRFLNRLLEAVAIGGGPRLESARVPTLRDLAAN